MHPAGETATVRHKMAYVMHTLIILFFHVVSLVASFVFCWKYISVDFKSASFSIMVMVGEVGMIYFLIAAILMRHQIGNLFTSLSEIYRNRKFILTDCHIVGETLNS